MPSHTDEIRALLAEGRQLARGENRHSLAYNEPDDGPDAPRWSPSRARDEAREWDGARRPTWAEGDPDPREPPPRGRPTPTLQATWIDPEETPFVPAPRPGKAVPARLFSLVVVGAIIVLLAWLILPEVSFRLHSVNDVVVPNGVLSAQAVPLAPTRAATVQELFVSASDQPDEVIPAGTPIARLNGTTPDAFGSTTVDLSVPFDARLVSVDSLEGAVTQPGTPVVTVYDPRKMYVLVSVSPETLDTLRRGMRARLSSSLLSRQIGGTVVSAVPQLGTDYNPARNKVVNVRIQPDKNAIRDLVPGIRLNATIDLGSAPADAKPLVFTSSGDGAAKPSG